jgi:exosortase family protein XrtM
MKLPKLDPRFARVALFAGLFLIATGIHFFLRARIVPIVNHDINGAAATWIINFFTPQNHVHLREYTIGSESSAYITIKEGCDGIDALLMFACAILAFPMQMKRRLIGAGLGATLVFTFNLVRIVGLWYCARYWPSAFDTMHVIVGQTVLIVLALVFFLWWTRALGDSRGEPA